jgi:hypothetical protein
MNLDDSDLQAKDFTGTDGEKVWPSFSKLHFLKLSTILEFKRLLQKISQRQNMRN